MARQWLLAAVSLLVLSCACSKKQPAASPEEPTGAAAPHRRRVSLEIAVNNGVPAAPAPEAPRFYYDLGPATVDVSAYPPRLQENYKLFLAVCGTCHSTARPLNSPYAGADTWKRYVRRMHGKMESRSVLPSPEDESRILDFLVYDSKVRKTDKGEGFQAEQEKLKKLFEKPARN